jgi:hypothetical protein
MRGSPVAAVILLMSLAACASTPSARLTRSLTAYAGTFDHSVFTEMASATGGRRGGRTVRGCASPTA